MQSGSKLNRIVNINGRHFVASARRLSMKFNFLFCLHRTSLKLSVSAVDVLRLGRYSSHVSLLVRVSYRFHGLRSTDDLQHHHRARHTSNRLYSWRSR